MTKRLKRIVIVTRPKEELGYYEYFIEPRKRLLSFLFPNERGRFETALRNISEGKNPSGNRLTKPSERDFGIEIKPLNESYIYSWGGELFYFPNDKTKENGLSGIGSNMN